MKKTTPLIATLLLCGNLLNADINIHKGWQLRGTDSNFTMADFNKTCVNIVWTYDDVNLMWKAYSPDANMQQTIENSLTISALTNINPTDGFWVKGNENCNISMDTDENTTLAVDLVVPSELYDKYELLEAGTYIETGTKYYLLIFPENGNISIGWRNYSDGLSYTSTFVYDKNLNPVIYTNSSGDTSYMSLGGLKKAGVYIIKVNYLSKENEFVIYSPLLMDRESLPALTSGTFAGKGVKYYKLDVNQDASIIVDFKIYQDGFRYAGTQVYDEHLNPVIYTNSSGDTSYMSLGGLKKAGKYVVRVDYGNIDNEIVINSSAF